MYIDYLDLLIPVVVVIITVIGVIFAYKNLNKEAKLFFSLHSEPLIMFSPGKNPNISLTIHDEYQDPDNFKLVGDGDDVRDISTLYGYSITIKNVSGICEENFEIDIIFDDYTVFLEIYTYPESVGSYDIKKDVCDGKVSLIIPYINSKEVIKLGLVTGNNDDPNNIIIKGRGKSAKFREHSARLENTYFFSSIIIMFFTIFLLDGDTVGSILSENVINLLGGQVNLREDVFVTWSLSSIIIIVLISFIILLLFIAGFERSSLSSRDHRPWE